MTARRIIESSEVIRGEYWITDDGLLYASEGGDTNHEGHVIEAIIQRISDYLGEEWDFGPDRVAFRVHLADKVYPEKYGWEEEDPSGRLRDELAEHSVFRTVQEAEAAMDAIGGSDDDVRAFAMRYWGWIRVAGPNVELHAMTPEALKEAGEGLWDIASEEGFDDDNEIRNMVIRVSTYAGQGRQRREATIGELVDGEVGAGNTELDDIRRSGGAAVRKMDVDAMPPTYRGHLGDSLSASIIYEVEDQIGKPTPSVEQIAKKHGLSVDRIKAQVDKGVKVEVEHTKSRSQAHEIARDHVAEFPDYYDRLEKMETKAKKEAPVAENEAVPEEQAKQLARQFGLTYNGFQEGYKHIPGMWLFTDPVSGSTVALQTTEGAAELQAKVQALHAWAPKA